MSDEKPAVGTITWRDLTVPNAEQVRDFYQAVVGWGAEGCDMGGYEDFNMTVPGTGEGIAGVCHARGCNEGIPRPTRNVLFDEKIAGTIHLALGAGFPFLGGRNVSDLHWDLLRDMRDGGRVTIDGRLAYENGAWLT